MNRREFTQLAGLLLPLTRGGAVLGEPAAVAAPARFAFYDPRFPLALEHAARLGATGPWRAAGDDVSVEWQQLLRPALAHGPLVVTGITAPSASFCLEILVRERALVHLTQRRIDRDLIHWQLEAQAHG